MAASDDPAQLQYLEVIFENVLGIIVRLALLAVFVMLLLGGFNFLTSGGNPEAKAKAQKTLTWAISGFVVLLLGWFIMRFISEFTGIPEILKFEIPK